MAEILRLPFSATDEVHYSYRESAKRSIEKNMDTLDVLLELALKDTSTFRCLEAKCLSRKPFLMSSKARKRLYRLHLIDDRDNPTLEVISIMRSISETYYLL